MSVFKGNFMRLMRTTVFATTLALAGCATTTPPESQVRLPAPFTDQGVFVTVEGLYRNGYGTVIGISGTAVNESNRDLTLCQITLDILDGSGVKVSSAVAATNGLKSAQKWRFQATFTNPYVVTFRSIERGQLTTIASQQIGQPHYEPRQNQMPSNQLKAAVDQATMEYKEACRREEYIPLLLHTACDNNDISLEQLSDKSTIASTDKALFSRFRSEAHLSATKIAAALRSYGGSKGAEAALALQRSESFAEKNALALYGGTISWGDYNKRRREINDAFRDEFSKLAR